MSAAPDLDFGTRLFSERKRLEMTQGAMAKAAGVTVLTYGNYERGTQTPNATVLANLHTIGVDVLFVLTGTQNEAVLSPDDTELLVSLNTLDTRLRRSLVTGVLETIKVYNEN
ncbi:helix-turn-helix transcriptional regulator [Chitinivorax sp. B]|uniref:helix-turn-helix domain-containing protein n=1 Tax=Chitinivorax sp. B TaxID=2502235 RepID=UPI0010F7AF1A|nr:helix-turn-helix transcriptional regulator [Chitinivorax sp. B]